MHEEDPVDLCACKPHGEILKRNPPIRFSGRRIIAESTTPAVENYEFVGCNFDEICLDGASFSDCTFRDCTFIYGRERTDGMVNLYRPPTREALGGFPEAMLTAGSVPGHDIINADRISLPPGDWYARMVRPFPMPDPTSGATFYPRTDANPKEWRSAATTLKALSAHMNRVFLTIEPAPGNAGAYGHEIRQLLILACTEVENLCKGALRANHYVSTNPRCRDDRDWNMQDYKKFVAAQRQAEWRLTLANYPSHPGFSPFSDTNKDGNFRWYTAYNQTKHDRDSNFSEASLDHAIAAVGAAYIMFLSQFGQDFPTQSTTVDDFVVLGTPTWKPSEFYLPPWLAVPKGGPAPAPKVHDFAF